VIRSGVLMLQQTKRGTHRQLALFAILIIAPLLALISNFATTRQANTGIAIFLGVVLFAGVVVTANTLRQRARIEARQLELEPIDFTLQDVVESAIDIFDGQDVTRYVELTSAVDPDLPRVVSGDPTRLRQILENLIDDAMKFAEHGRIDVAAFGDNYEDDIITVRFEVVSTGTDTNPGHQNRLSERFSPLANARQLIALMDGEVGVSNELEGGSAIWFTLPFTRPSDKALPSNDGKQSLDQTPIVMIDNATDSAVETADSPKKHDTAALIDLRIVETLRSITEEDEGFEALLGRFVDTSQGLIQKLESSLATHDISAAQAVVHSLKGSTATFGALRLTELSKQIEAFLRDGEEEKARDLAQSLGPSLVDTQRAYFTTTKKYEPSQH